MNPNGSYDVIEDVLGGLDVSDLPVEQARTLPAECYTSPAFYEFEREAVFSSSWLCMGREDQIPSSGDFMTRTVAGEPLITVRGRDGVIRVMSSVCQHRAHLVAEGSGHVRAFSCPLHAWTYDLTGQLTGAPHMDATVDRACLKSETRLPQLRTELWHGFVFANHDPNAKPLGPTLSKFEPFFDGYDLDDMVTIPPRSGEPFPFNWKGLFENYIEPYHTQFVHPIIHDFAPSKGTRFTGWEDGDGGIVRAVPFLTPDGGLTAEGWAAPASFPIIDSLSQQQRSQVSFGLIPPTMNLIFTPDMICYGIATPTSAETVEVEGGLFTYGGWIVPRSTAELNDFDERAERLMHGSRQLGEQDAPANISVQAGKNSRYATRGRYSYLEETLSQFNRWLAPRYREHARSGDSAPRRACEPAASMTPSIRA